jgi:hypothetical protein
VNLTLLSTMYRPNSRSLRALTVGRVVAGVVHRELEREMRLL